MTRTHAILVGFVAIALSACGDDEGAAETGGMGGGAGGMGGESGMTGGRGGDAPTPRFSFFVTSVGSGSDGGNLGGLAGADQLCLDLATAVGAGDRTWRAYLSTSSVDARDRIGSGPWYNQRLQEIAPDVESLHRDQIPRLLWNTEDDPDEAGLVIDENGDLVPLSEHDIITGSESDGTVFEGRTCLDWTSDSEDEVAQVGHSDIAPPEVSIPGVDVQSWNSAHETVSCTEEGLAVRQGAGRFYCFAID